METTDKKLQAMKDTLNSETAIYRKLSYVLKTATDQDRLDGAIWYGIGEQICENWSREFDLPKLIVASVVSCLSPACSWIQNLKDARTVLEAHSSGVTDSEQVTCSTYGNNVRKAFLILATGNPEHIGNGLKTTSFAMNLAGMWNENAVTIDRHMLGLAVGSRTTLHQKLSVTPKRYRTISSAIKKLAKREGLEPRQVQAILWESFRTRVGLKK
jgi:hypothetical protein